MPVMAVSFLIGYIRMRPATHAYWHWRKHKASCTYGLLAIYASDTATRRLIAMHRVTCRCFSPMKLMRVFVISAPNTASASVINGRGQDMVNSRKYGMASTQTAYMATIRRKVFRFRHNARVILFNSASRLTVFNFRDDDADDIDAS